MYGVTSGEPTFARNCLLARRLAEAGVPFIQLYHADWDHHNFLPRGLEQICRETDRSVAALIADLKQRGLLDDTLVIWGGEFGRTPMNQGEMKNGQYGRDHQNRAFTMWMAGGGIKRGLTYGATDELGYFITENEVHVHDLHATVLHCLGMDHTALTYRSRGRVFRLTDVSGRVVHDLLA
jgi:uncharacterized protein (DUF1501 family)